MKTIAVIMVGLVSALTAIGQTYQDLEKQVRNLNDQVSGLETEQILRESREQDRQWELDEAKQKADMIEERRRLWRAAGVNLDPETFQPTAPLPPYNPFAQFEDRSPQQIIVQPDVASERVKTELMAYQQGYAIDWQGQRKTGEEAETRGRTLLQRSPAPQMGSLD